jgi:hypothetical protein
MPMSLFWSHGRGGARMQASKMFSAVHQSTFLVNQPESMTSCSGYGRVRDLSHPTYSSVAPPIGPRACSRSLTARLGSRCENRYSDRALVVRRREGRVAMMCCHAYASLSRTTDEVLHHSVIPAHPPGQGCQRHATYLVETTGFGAQCRCRLGLA